MRPVSISCLCWKTFMRAEPQPLSSKGRPSMPWVKTPTKELLPASTQPATAETALCQLDFTGTADLGVQEVDMASSLYPTLQQKQCVVGTLERLEAHFRFLACLKSPSMRGALSHCPAKSIHQCHGSLLSHKSQIAVGHCSLTNLGETGTGH